ncbi:MAG: hypothetical protein EOO77_05670 [Oxalobacteraceae bacterium]|nr:MAG: hypothetical protein EOO77_05670 [Oxalobacteraceae bacterium]
MPDLSKTTVETWLETQDSQVAKLWGGAVRPIEDDADVRSALSEMGNTLDHSLNKDAGKLSAALRDTPTQATLRSVLVQLGPARLFRLLHWFSAAGLPEADKVLGGLLQDEPSGVGKMLRQAVQEMQRQELLARLFSRGRLETLLAACQDKQPEAA